MLLPVTKPAVCHTAHAQAAARAAGPSAVAGVARQPYKGLGDALASIIKSEGKRQAGKQGKQGAHPCNLSRSPSHASHATERMQTRRFFFLLLQGCLACTAAPTSTC